MRVPPFLNYLLTITLVILFCGTTGGMGGESSGAAGTSSGRSGDEAPDKLDVAFMAGQMILAGFRGTGDEPLHEDLANILEDIAQGKVGGVILFDRDAILKTPNRNILSPGQVLRLTRMLQGASPLPLFIGVDQEGGKVRRLKEEQGFPPLASAEELGRASPESTEKAGKQLGAYLHSLGINLNFAPCLDVNSNPGSPAVGALGRSFSRDPASVAAHGLAFAKGLSAGGVIPCFKHFPGHGSATADTHLGLADITATWEEAELLPYRDILPKTPPAMVMPGHIVHREKTGNFPASLSQNAIRGMLREELGWEGVVITDDLQMQAVEGRFSTKEALRLAVLAGADILLLGNNLRHDSHEARKAHALLLELVDEGAIPASRIKESYQRIIRLKREAGLLDSSYAGN